MTEKDLLRAVGQIDERFIMEADPSADASSRTETKVLSFSQKESTDYSRRRRMRRLGTVGSMAAAFLVLVIGLSVYQGLHKSSMQSVPDIPYQTSMQADDVADEANALPVPEEDDASGQAEVIPGEAGEAAPGPEAALQEAGEEAPEPEAAPYAAYEMTGAQEASAPKTDEKAENTEDAVPAVPSAGDLSQAAAYDAEDDFEEAYEMLTEMATDAAEYSDVSDRASVCETMEEAAAAAGFTLIVPEAEDPWNRTVIEAAEYGMIRVTFLNEEEKEGYQIRKAKKAENTEDGNTDNRDDSETTIYEWPEQDEKNPVQVTVKEEEGVIRSASWTKGEYVYLLLAGEKEFDEEQLKDLVLQTD